MEWMNSLYVEWLLTAVAILFVICQAFCIWGTFSDLDSFCGNESHATPADILLLEEEIAELESFLTKLRATDV